ncbi:TonB-dependent receptor [Gloeobacter morelensis]|uniref:TonB-dependent receptor n=1 Tax=Gloeobacter morelensis MG652769 TaxID=2781736 RepID=A0ABY3PII0_9CYAN|nr:TonB-dependent receptor [Gloeobacter morelensis]UFP93452.1 TonB-dependent receptor [Gloeobacter morelensis MG652769]
MKTSSRLGGALAWAVLLPAFATMPAAYAGPVATVAANSQTVSLEGAKALLDQTRGRAADLQARPALWDWTTPATAPRTAQAPTPPPATTPAPADQTADETTDILDEVSVTATRRPTRQRDTTATTYAVTKQDFKAQGAVTATDALQLIPGFVGQPSLGGVRNAGANFLRGFDDQRFQVLRDGLNLTFPQNGRSAVSQIQVDDLERIEVVTGGATLRYGAGAVGGVINLITETPKGPPKLTLEYQAGSYGFTRYLGKYGGGDDTFSYNLLFSSVVAFNNYPFKITVPNTTQFYGPSANPNSRPPQNAIDQFLLPGTTAPGVYPNAVFDDDGNYVSGNSNNIAGPGNNDPANSGSVDLFGFLKPDIGPPVTVQGTADASYTAGDSYTAKLTWKPDPSNRLTLRANQANRRFDDQGPGANYFNLCLSGATSAPDGNGTTFGNRFYPLDQNGNEVGCNGGRLSIGTPTTQFAFGFPFAFNTSFDGSTVFPTGNPYPAAEGALANILFFTRRSTSNTELSLNWDYEVSPTTSINSYVAYYRQVFQTSRPRDYLYNTNYFGTGIPPGIIPFGTTSQPFSDGTKFEAQTAINTQLSPGQTLSFGINFQEDRVNQQQGGGTTFFDRAIARTSLFLVDDISFGDLVKANVGVRYTSSSQFGEVVTPAAGLRVTPLPWLSLRGNWSQVFNAPNIADLYVVSGPFIDNPNLQPETGITYDFGADFTPLQNLGIRVTYFNTYLNDTFTTIAFVAPFVGLQQQVQNIAGNRASGIEAEVNWRISEQLNARVAYTNTDSRLFGLNDSLINGNFLYQYQNTAIPFNNLVGTLSYQNKGLLVALLGRYDSGKRRPGTDTFVGAWATLDLNVELPITPYFTILGNVFNITDTQYEFFPGNPAPGTTFRVGARLEVGG